MHLVRILAALLVTGIGIEAGGSEAILQRLEPDLVTGASTAVIVDNLSLAHTAQLLPFDERGQIVPGDVSDQTKRVLESLGNVLATAGCNMERTAKLNFYISTSNDLPVLKKILVHEFSDGNKPAVTFVVTPLPNPAARVGLDAVALPRYKSKAPKVEWISPLGYHDREI